MARSRQERRFNTERKLNKRKKLASDFGLNSGLLYERHIEKLETSFGYMRDGNVSHYVQIGHMGYRNKMMRLCDKLRNKEQNKVDVANKALSDYKYRRVKDNEF